MTLTEILFAVFALLIIGLCLPLSYAARMALFLALIAVGVLTFLGGGMQFMIAQLR